MGWLELILNTPSHHRVHHGKDEKYIDRNFGGILIIWDRLFKTFQKEEEPPKYGITKPLNSHNFIKIISHEWVDMINDLRKSVGIKSALKNIVPRGGGAGEAPRRADHAPLPVFRTGLPGVPAARRRVTGWGPARAPVRRFGGEPIR